MTDLSAIEFDASLVDALHDVDELSLECFRIPHFYRAFYVYKYATGLSAAIAAHDCGAKVTVVEAFEFACPYFAESWPILKQLLEAYPNDVKVVFKHNPLPFHPDAKLAAQATIAAHEQGKFWEMHDKLFANQRALNDENYVKWAQELELDVEKFKKLGLKKIVCYCPHCFTTLKNDYKQYGLELEVVHHSDLIAELMAAGREMLAHPIELLSHAREAVEAVAETHRVVLITKGDLLDQERKVAQSGLGDVFDVVEIVGSIDRGFEMRHVSDAFRPGR